MVAYGVSHWYEMHPTGRLRPQTVMVLTAHDACIHNADIIPHPCEFSVPILCVLFMTCCSMVSPPTPTKPRQARGRPLRSTLEMMSAAAPRRLPMFPRVLQIVRPPEMTVNMPVSLSTARNSPASPPPPPPPPPGAFGLTDRHRTRPLASVTAQNATRIPR
jgi:hypothetical protein